MAVMLAQRQAGSAVARHAAADVSAGAWIHREGKRTNGSEVGGCEDGDNKRAHGSLPDVWLMALVLQILVLMTRKGLRQRGSALREDRHPLNL